MSDDRKERVLAGRDKILMTAAALDEDCNTTTDLMMAATVEVLLTTVLDDRMLAAEHLRRVAEVVERGRFMDSAAGSIH